MIHLELFSEKAKVFTKQTLFRFLFFVLAATTSFPEFWKALLKNLETKTLGFKVFRFSQIVEKPNIS